MITIHIDGDLMFDSTQLDDEAYTLVDPRMTLEDGGGSLTFTMPPGNRKYNAVKKKKSIVTVAVDDVLRFRGRVTEIEADMYNQKRVYCEHELDFLKDSQWHEGMTTGTAQDFFRSIIANHNGQVEEDKRFTAGVISAVDANKLVQVGDGSETRRYWNTADMIREKLVGAYGGKIRARTAGDTHYIDWLDAYEEENAQNIQFAVNLLDLKNREDAGDVFTVLIPLGYSEIQDDGTYSAPVNITSVNGGKNYIEDAEGIEKHGKIWKVHTWAATEDPAELLEKAQAFMNVGMELQSLTLTAVDMHFTYGDIQMIEPFKKVNILSEPHGLDLNIACVKIDSPLMEPENTVYTFGEPPETLTEQAERTEKEVSGLTGGGRGGGGRKSVQEEAQDILRWASVQVDETKANVNINAGEINKISGDLTQALVDIDGLEADILLKADAKTVTEQGETLSQALVDIDGLEADILLKASQTDLDGMETTVYARLDAQEDEMEAQAGTITLHTNKINALETEFMDFSEAFASFEAAAAERVTTGNLIATTGFIGSLSITEGAVNPQTIPIVTNYTPALGEAATVTEYTLLTVA